MRNGLAAFRLTARAAHGQLSEWIETTPSADHLRTQQLMRGRLI